MIKSDNTIPAEMFDTLRTCKGKKLEAILSTEKTDKDLSFILVILRFDDFDLELWALEKPYIEGELADLTEISIKNNPDKNTKNPWGTEDKKGVFHPAKMERVPVGKTVKGINVHNELVQWTYEDESFLLANTYAIVFSLGTRYLHFIKDDYWTDMWRIVFSQSPVPTPPEWDESEGDKYDITYSVIEL